MLPAPLEPILAVPALHQVEAKLLELLRGLTLDDWNHETIVSGWRVRHVAAHLLDTALRKLSIVRDGFAVERPASLSPAGIADFVNRANAEGVAVYGRLSPRALTELMEPASHAFCQFHQQLDPFAPAAFAVTWAGHQTSPNWFDTARELTERWHHQQQIRLALNRPGIMTRALYHPVLDCFLRVLPHAYRDVDAPEGTVVEVVVDGACGGSWRIIRTSAAWHLTAASLPSQARLTIPQEIAWRLFTKGIPRDEAERQTHREGDEQLARPALSAVAIVT